MANFIISPYAISYNSIKNALQTYINDKNVSSVLDVWSDFYTAGAGQTIVELDAAIASFYAFHFIIGRREAYLPVAQNYTSVLGGAQSLGYSASRGHDVYAILKIIPYNSQTITKWSIVGVFEEYDIVFLGKVERDAEGNIKEIKDTASIVKGEEIELAVVVGNSTAQAIQISSSDIQQFTYTADDVTDDVRLILNDTEVPFTSEIRDAVDDKYIMLTNTYGAVDVFYLNKGNYKYTTQDTLYLQYIQRNTLTYSVLAESSMEVDFGEVADMSLLEDRKGVQDKESIRVAASVYHETNNVVRARRDFAKKLLQDNTLNLIDTNDKDINPGLMAITYLREDNTQLTDSEKKSFMEKAIAACPDGVCDVFIEDPIPVVRKLGISLWQNVGETIPADINDYIDGIIKSYNNVLGQTLDLEAIENSLEQLPGVKIARVDFGASEYATNKKYKSYDIVEVKNIPVGNDLETWNFICLRVQTASGDTKPAWESAQVYGRTVTDSNLVWEKTNKYVSSIPYKWEANREFSMYANISDGYTIYAKSTSGSASIKWDKTVVIDGNVTFNKVKTYDEVLPLWQADMPFTENQYVVFKKEFAQSNNEKGIYAIYKVADLLSRTGENQPNWSSAEDLDDEIQDGAISWKLTYLGYDDTAEYSIGDTVAVVIEDDGQEKVYIYTCSNADGCNADTKYATTQVTGAEANPFDKSETIKEWVITTDENDEEVGAEGQVVWVLDSIIEDGIYTWSSKTTVPILSYTYDKTEPFTYKHNNIFQATDISNFRTGTVDWFGNISSTDDVPEEKEDGNIVWVLDTFTYGGIEDNKIIGTTRYPLARYDVGNVVIVSNDFYTYVYNVTYTNDSIITSDNDIYTVCNYCGTTSDEDNAPEWTYTKIVNDEEITESYLTVVDNDILWTKVDIKSDLEWTADTQFELGTIISTEGGYYMFTDIMGTSGTYNDDTGEYMAPNWAGINDGIVKDNHIVWQRLETVTKAVLKWNEYLQLSYEITNIY